MTEERRVALVTGAGRGIGLGIARALARGGHDLMINDLHEPSKVEPALDELRGLGAAVRYARGDISRGEDRERIVAAAVEAFGALNLLVNNAGVSSRERGVDLLDASEEALEWLLRINFNGPHFLTQIAAREMIARKQADPAFPACVVNITSISAEVVSVGRGDYCISKAALAMSTKLWASRLAEHGIAVYEIRPGIIRTDMTEGVVAKYAQFIADGNLLEPRWGTPDDIGRAVAMLARGDLPYATGHTLVLDGGLTLPRL